MPYIQLAASAAPGQTILVFAEGTVLKPRSLFSLYNHRTYCPIGNAVAHLTSWQTQGAKLIYCTSRRGKQAEDMAKLLRQYAFPGARLYFRGPGERYADLVETIRPAVLIEDDCRSIGGSWQMCITHVDPAIRRSIQSIAVREFGGIDHLPSGLRELCAAKNA